MRIAVVGTGYVGLVTSAGLAEFGNDVACVCEDEDELARLADGKVGMYEPGLPELVATNLKAGRIRFTADLDGAVLLAKDAADGVQLHQGQFVFPSEPGLGIRMLK